MLALMPRYVLLRHEVPASFGRASHWDLLLERDDACETWALDELPVAWAERLGAERLGIDSTDAIKSPTSAIRLPAHRKHYLSFAGPVSNNRGTVARVAAGEYVALEWTDARIIIEYQTGHLTGSAQLTQTADSTWACDLA